MPEELEHEIEMRLKKKFGRIIEIERLTNELDEALRRNDKQSVNMILGMRGEEMDAVDSIDAELAALERALPKASFEAVKNFKEDCGESPVGEIVFLKQRINKLLEKIIEKDRAMNMRIAGKYSFYTKQK